MYCSLCCSKLDTSCIPTHGPAAVLREATCSVFAQVPAGSLEAKLTGSPHLTDMCKSSLYTESDVCKFSQGPADIPIAASDSCSWPSRCCCQVHPHSNTLRKRCHAVLGALQLLLISVHSCTERLFYRQQTGSLYHTLSKAVVAAASKVGIHE